VQEEEMNTELRNASSWELRALAHGKSPLAQIASRILAEREEASTRLSEICKAVKDENTCQRS